jgi:hypothetical protein
LQWKNWDELKTVWWRGMEMMKWGDNVHDECVTEIEGGRKRKKKEEDSNREAELRVAKDRRKRQVNHERQLYVEEVSDEDVEMEEMRRRGHRARIATEVPVTVVNDDEQELPDEPLEHSDGEDGKYPEHSSSSSDSDFAHRDPDQCPQSSDTLPLFLLPARIPSSTTPNKRHLRRTPPRPLSPTAVLPKMPIRHMRTTLLPRRGRPVTRVPPQPPFPTDPPSLKRLLYPTMSSAYKPTTTSDIWEKAIVRVKYLDPSSHLSGQTPRSIHTTKQQSGILCKPSTAPASQ